MEKREISDIRKEYTSLVNRISTNSAKYDVAKVKYNDLVAKRDKMLSRKNALESEIASLNKEIEANESDFISNKQNKLFNKVIGISFVPTIVIDAALLLSGNIQEIGNTALNVALFNGIPQFACCSSIYGLMNKGLTSKYRNQYRRSEDYVRSIDKINECERVICDYSELLEDLNRLVDLAQRAVISLDNKIRYLNVELKNMEEELNSTESINIESHAGRVLNR